MTRIRLPHPALRAYVAQVWASDAAPAAFDTPRREHALPTGCAHLVFRLSDAPLRIAAAKDTRWQALGPAMLGGPRSRYYQRELAAPSASVGALLLPGATLALFGVPADEFAECHAPLDVLWGAEAARLHARLAEAGDADARLAFLEDALLARLPAAPRVHPGVAAFLATAQPGDAIADAVRASGMSHRHFIRAFSAAAGLTPASWLRLRRFRQALDALHRSSLPLAALAYRSGYADQAHFCRDFAEFAGMTPSAYRARAPRAASHVPIDAANRSNPCKTADSPMRTIRHSATQGASP